MKSTLTVIISIAITTIIEIQTQILLPSTVFHVVRTSGIINFIQLPELHANEFSSKCQLKLFDGPNQISIDLNNFVFQPYKLNSSENIKKISSDLCGVRLYPISKILDDCKISLVMAYNNGTEVNISFEINVLDQIENISPINISKTFPGLYQLPYDVHYHEYEDELGGRYENQNDIYFGSYNSDKWIGRGLYRYQMNEIKTIYNLIDDDLETVKYAKRTTIETAESYIIQCDLNIKSYSGICYARKPDNSLVNIGTGLSSDKYTSYDSQVLKGFCTIEILKPYDELDKGIWKIVFPGVNAGCIFSVDGENEKKARIKDILSTFDSPIQIDVDVTPTRSINFETITIKCEYPDEIEFCILHNPYGHIELEETEHNAKSTMLGYCTYTVKPIPGLWICSIKTRDSEILKSIYYQMNTYNGSYITTNSTNVRKFVTESIQLMCRTRFKYKIEYCVFESPSGLWYSFSEETRNQINRVSYVGKGLRYGDCGIELQNIQRDDFGNWTCHVKIKKQTTMYSYQNIKFTLVEDEVVSSAVVLGLSITFGIIILGLFTRFIYTRYRTTRNRNINSSDIAIE